MSFKKLTTTAVIALVIFSGFSAALAATYEELKREYNVLVGKWSDALDAGDKAKAEEYYRQSEAKLAEMQAAQPQQPTAGGNQQGMNGVPDPNFSLIVPIPGLSRQVETNPLEYIKGIYNFGVGFGMLVAVAIIVFAGLKWTTSAGNPSAQSEAKDMILNAVFGIAMLLGAVLILRTIDPKLTTLTLPKLDDIRTSHFDFNLQYGNAVSAFDAANAKKQFHMAEQKRKEAALEAINKSISDKVDNGEPVTKDDLEEQKQALIDVQIEAVAVAKADYEAAIALVAQNEAVFAKLKNDPVTTWTRVGVQGLFGPLVGGFIFDSYTGYDDAVSGNQQAVNNAKQAEADTLSRFKAEEQTLADLQAE